MPFLTGIAVDRMKRTNVFLGIFPYEEFQLSKDIGIYRYLKRSFPFLLASSSEAESDSESESEEGTGTTESSKTPDLSTCPLRSLVHAYEDNEDYEDNSYSPIQPDQSDSGPVDPVFVDEESSGEAVASAGI